jgi:hypothetical protein
VHIPPASMAFTLLLSLLVALPSFGIDMSLPALTARGAALGVAPAQAGMMMSLFMLGFAPRAAVLWARFRSIWPKACRGVCVHSSSSPGSAAHWPARCRPSSRQRVPPPHDADHPVAKHDLGTN